MEIINLAVKLKIVAVKPKLAAILKTAAAKEHAPALIVNVDQAAAQRKKVRLPHLDVALMAALVLIVSAVQIAAPRDKLRLQHLDVALMVALVLIANVVPAAAATKLLELENLLLNSKLWLGIMVSRK